MSFLGTNKHNASWAQRQQAGFSRYSHNPQPSSAKETEEVRKAVDGLTFSRPGSSSQTLRPGPPNYQNRTTAGAEAAKAKEDSSNQQASISVPRYVETEKQVLRFYCHFFEQEAMEQPTRSQRGRNKPKPRPRLFTLFIFVEDFSVEIIEDRIPNSGVQGGKFYSRNPLKKRDGSKYNVDEFAINRRINALGHDFYITDCDSFTREYFRRQFGIVMGDPLPRPEVEIVAQQVAKGAALAAAAPLEGDDSASTPVVRGNASRSADYEARREQLDRTHKYLHGDNRVLRFKCIELTNPQHQSMVDKMANTPTTLCLSYFMVDDCVDVRVVRNTRVSHDDPTAILKKSKLPKNWRTASAGGKQDNYSYTDLVCGSTIDCFGRKIFIIGCDEPTRQFYSDLGISQREIIVEDPQSVRHEKDVPRYGEGGLAIGSSDDSLRTVFNRSKVQQKSAVAKYAGLTLRARCRLVSNRGVDSVRSFLLTYYLDDNTVGVFEDQVKNSGVTGGNFLRRGVYQNELPPEGGGARRFLASDVFLGNTVILNGYNMEIVQMDDLSVKFCEDNFDDFPFFDPYEVVDKLLGRVISAKADLRSLMTADHDPKRRNWFTQEQLMDCLDSLSLSASLNDQELMTIMRICKETSIEPNQPHRYYYHELCDLFSYCYCKRQAGVKRGKKTTDPLDMLLDDMRARQTRWRHTLRLDPNCLSNCITLEDLTTCLTSNNYRFTLPNQRTVVEHYALPSVEANAILEIMNKDLPDKSSAPAPGRGRGRSRPDPSDELDSARIVIDVHAMCNDMYICDWVD